MSEERNVLGEPLQPCSKFPMTGFFRDSYCRTCTEDLGIHTVCVKVTDDFLRFSKEVGNDLTTPAKEYDFPGLIEGDWWCLCAARWLEAYAAGVAPSVNLHATHERTLEIIPLEALTEKAVDPSQDDSFIN